MEVMHRRLAMMRAGGVVDDAAEIEAERIQAALHALADRDVLWSEHRAFVRLASGVECRALGREALEAADCVAETIRQDRADDDLRLSRHDVDHGRGEQP